MESPETSHKLSAVSPSHGRHAFEESLRIDLDSKGRMIKGYEVRKGFPDIELAAIQGKGHEAPCNRRA